MKELRTEGYCGFKIIAKNEFNVGEIIPGLKGIVVPCLQDIDDTPELNYSFLRENFRTLYKDYCLSSTILVSQIVGIRNQRVNLVCL